MIEKEESSEIFIDGLEKQRENIKKNINKILAPLPKRNARLENRLIDHLLINVEEVINFSNQKIDDEQISYLIRRAKSDIKLANEAYKGMDFNNTIYLLQQSTEKIVKSYGLFLGIIKDPQREIGHEPSKFYLLMLEKSWIKKIPDVINIDSKKSISYLKFLERNTKAKLELDASVPFLLKLFNNILKNANKELSKREMKQVLLGMKNFNGFNLKKFLITQIYFSYFICPFAIISSAHQNIPRYSDDITELKIISNFPKISRILNNSISYIEKDMQQSKLKDD